LRIHPRKREEFCLREKHRPKPISGTMSHLFFFMLKRIGTLQTYGPDLAEAYKWCAKYQETRRDADLHQAWDLYYHIFRRINKTLPTVLSLDLKDVSSSLYGAQDLELAVPGTYAAGEPVVSIQRFAQTLQARFG
jgi:serine/threonine-protein kinase mTOR